MSADSDSEIHGHLVGVADDVIPTISRIALLAKEKLNSPVSSGADSLINPSDASVANLWEAQDSVRETYRRLVVEPAIARIVATNDRGETQTYYICRVAPVTGVKNLGSYRAPIGRLAALEIGGELELPNGTVLEVQERALLRPGFDRQGWDSLRTVFESNDIGPVTIESLRALLHGVDGEALSEDLVSILLEEAAQNENIAKGIRRNRITKMQLRDQPLLDQYQDAIFRLPIDSRLLLLGPPGTGKTTTLIRRLGQKLDYDFLDENEQQVVASTAENADTTHARSWLMFTPTELLKQYLKEAFAREDVPASDKRITTWIDYQRELGRNAFGVLRSGAGVGYFVLKPDVESIGNDAMSNPIAWFEDFNDWQQSEFHRALGDAAAGLSTSTITRARELGSRLREHLQRSGANSLAAVFTNFESEASQIAATVASLKDSSDAKIRGWLNLQLNQNREFIKQLAAHIGELQQAQTPSVVDGEDIDEDDDADEATPRNSAATALRAYTQAVRAYARAAVRKRALSNTSLAGKIIDWLGARKPEAAELRQVGESLAALTQARTFSNPVKRYFDGIPKRYRAFRELRQQGRRWYGSGSFRSQDLNPLELDCILLAMMRGGSELLSQRNVQRRIDEPAWSYLNVFRHQYRNQILVDEATDFSPLQLACMASLTHPRVRSFFACGDFNQRLTTWGARSIDQLKWIYPEFDVREVSVAYRQSRQLNDFARELIRIVGGTESASTLPANVDNDGVPPVLLESADFDSQVTWLADRIREIEHSLGQLPSIGILVNCEGDVGPMADALSGALAEDNIRVIACREGRSVGNDGSVRVFDIQHIKGLEFEAVFFIGIDELAAQQPQLFDKYLYVGTTRAATYLGLTCSSALPSALESLRSQFTGAWS